MNQFVVINNETLKMHNPLPFPVLVIFLLLACAKADHNSRDIKKDPYRTVIAGRIQGSYWNEVSLSYIDTMEQRKYMAIEPDSTELFKFVLTANWPGEFTVTVSNNTFQAVYFPGDSIFMQGELQGYNDDFVRHLTFSGDDTSYLSYYRDKSLNPDHIDIRERFWEAKRAPYSRFTQIIDSLYLEKLRLFQVDTIGKNLSQKVIGYELASLKYKYLDDKLSEPDLRLHLSFDSTKVPQNYFEFIKSISTYDSTAYNNMYYYRFLDVLNYQLSDPESLPVYPIVDRLDIITRNGFRLADSLLSGKVSGYFLTKMISDYLRVDIEKADSLINTLDNKTVSLKDTIHSLTYLGVWSIGCKGCQMDFQNKQKLVEEYSDFNIQFIDVCTTKDLVKVKSYLTKFPKTGLHLLDLSEELKQFLNIRALPTYFLIDGTGKILEHNFYRPGDPMLTNYLEGYYLP